VMINGLKFCPHHPEAQVKEYRMSCNCRKPNPGMIEELCELHSIEPGLSFMIGDSETDVSAGKAAKLKESFLIPSNKAGALENCITNILQYTN
jgi:HAD superfamily hydrolase (TIGR01662 family)